MSYEFKYALGNIQAGSVDTVFKPRTIRGATKYPVIVLHGASTTPTPEFYGTTFQAAHKLCAVLANEGIPVVTGFMGGNTYANDAMSGTSGTAYMNAALTYVAAQTGCSSAKAHVIGTSMGGACAVRWASLNPTKAASITGVIPAVSLEHIFTDNPNNVTGPDGFTGQVATAWGLTRRTITDGAVSIGSATLTSAAGSFTVADVGRQLTRPYNQTAIATNTKVLAYVSPTQVTMDKPANASAGSRLVDVTDPLPMSGTAGADLIGFHAPRLLSNSIPNRYYYATDDPYIYSADVTAIATAAGGTAYSMGATGHDNDAYIAAASHNGGTDFSDLVDWLKTNGS